MISLRLKKFLDQQQIPYETHIHRTAYTAQQVAAEEHVPGRMVAKTIIVELDGQMAMAVLPAVTRNRSAGFTGLQSYHLKSN